MRDHLDRFGDALPVVVTFSDDLDLVAAHRRHLDVDFPVLADRLDSPAANMSVTPIAFSGSIRLTAGFALGSPGPPVSAMDWSNSTSTMHWSFTGI